MEEDKNLNDVIKKSIEAKSNYFNNIGINNFSNSTFNNLIPTALQRSFELQNKSLQSMTKGLNALGNFYDNIGLNKTYLEPIIFQQSFFSSVLDSINSIKALKESIGINSFMPKISEILGLQQEVMGSLFNSLQSISEIFKNMDFSSMSKLNGMDCELLKRFYWVIPFEYEYEKIENLSKYKNRIEFEKYMLKYFNNNRVKRMFYKARKQCIEKDKKALIQQIENSYLGGDYAICITSLITLLDGLTLQLIEPNSDRQHLSYRAINDMLGYINDCPANEFSYELYLKVDILNNFYMKLYEDEEKFKTTNKRMLSRHINSHGVKYLNKKIEVLRLVNTVVFCQCIINETNLQEQFTRTKKDKSFVKIPN
ncbi:MAG: hypothetical protein PHR25_05505 [Clostridia bacterium]|nr:hypothetical protein [Clostridia bacterium]